MPIYRYECKSCHKQFEVEQRITADPLTDCDCGAKGSLKRLIQPIAVMFKGSGFHINDYSSTGLAEKSANKIEETSNHTKQTNETSATVSTPDESTSVSKTESLPAPSKSADISSE